MKSTLLLLLGLTSHALADVATYGQCGGQGYDGETTCVSGACCTYSNDWYSQCLPCDDDSSSGDDSSDDDSGSDDDSDSSGSATTPTAVTTTLPSSAGATSASTAISVSGSYDGGMKRFERSPDVCEEQTETGEDAAMFILEDGATLSNVIIGASQAEGVHCRGTCTLVNVWWADVCEDAATFKQDSGTSQVIGGGAFKADDKILQFNGFGTLKVSNFYAEDYGKVVRSCGNCSGNGNARHIVIDNVIAVDGGVLCGINTNYGDTCTITNSCQDDGKTCALYEGNNDGDEPEKISTGADGEYCIVSSFTESC